EFERARCRDALAREQHTHGLPVRDLALQQGHAAVQRHAADQRLGQPEARLVAGHDDVAAQHHLEAAAQRVAVDARDHGYVERLAQRDAAKAAGARRGPVVHAAHRRVLQVRTDAEGALARARQNDHTHIAVVLQLGPDALQLRLGGEIDRVERIGARQRDGGDVILDREFDGHWAPAPAVSCAITSCVCWPRRGGARYSVTGAADIWIGLPTNLTG